MPSSHCDLRRAKVAGRISIQESCSLQSQPHGAGSGLARTRRGLCRSRCQLGACARPQGDTRLGKGHATWHALSSAHSVAACVDGSAISSSRCDLQGEKDAGQKAAHPGNRGRAGPNAHLTESSSLPMFDPPAAAAAARLSRGRCAPPATRASGRVWWAAARRARLLAELDAGAIRGLAGTGAGGAGALGLKGGKLSRAGATTSCQHLSAGGFGVAWVPTERSDMWVAGADRRRGAQRAGATGITVWHTPMIQRLRKQHVLF